MTNDTHSPGEEKFCAHWGLTYDDYRRAIALQTHYTNRFPAGIDTVMVGAAEDGRARQLIVAMLDLNEALMPRLGDAEISGKLQELAALWAAKHEEGNTH